MATPVIISAALNGNRGRDEHSAIPTTPAEIAAEAVRCREAGASIFHVHARAVDGGWTAELGPWQAVIRELRQAVPDGLISATSIRPADVPVAAVLALLAGLAADPATKPDLISVNLGHMAVWEPVTGPGPGRRTRHFPNDYEDVARLLRGCAALGIQPELGLMDLGFVSNAVALQEDRLLPARPWFLVELDNPGTVVGGHVVPSTVAHYEVITEPLRRQFPGAVWCAHGGGMDGYAVIERALADGAHARVGFEDAVQLPDGTSPRSNADLVAWAVDRAASYGRVPISGVGAARLVTNGGADPGSE
jgi:3-keto-5-aminohexanoate cleavage enzyme